MPTPSSGSLRRIAGHNFHDITSMNWFYFCYHCYEKQLQQPKEEGFHSKNKQIMKRPFMNKFLFGKVETKDWFYRDLKNAIPIFIIKAYI